MSGKVRHLSSQVKRIVQCALILTLVIICIEPVSVQADIQQAQMTEWNLGWHDEFDSDTDPIAPDSQNWGYETGYVRNKEWQYYTNDIQNAYCKDGYLHIEAHKLPAGTYPVGSYMGQDGSISSASLISKNLTENQYGRLEIRASIDTRPGSWPAFWTMGINGEWPDCGECDIMEYYQQKLLFNVAWWLSGDSRWTARWDSSQYNLSAPELAWTEGFHVWAREWTPTQIRLYMDGILLNTWDASQDSGDTSIEGFHQPHYMIINQAIGGTAGGDASNLVLPTSYVVDWVRWYEDPTKYADRETNTSGTISGSYFMVGESDNNYESITEVQAGGKPSARYSRMEHTWMIDIGSASDPELWVEAFHNANSDSDDFVFSYSIDNINFTDALTVNKTADDDTFQQVLLPTDLSGVVYIRVRDANRTPGNKSLDTLNIDSLFIRTQSGVINPLPKVYCENITMTSRTIGKIRSAQANVLIKDETGAAAAGATVYGYWSGDVSQIVSGTTQSDGTVIFQSPSLRRSGTFTWTLSRIVKTGYYYDPQQNLMTSNSISIP